MGKVLIVEDSEDMNFALCNLVRKEGYPVLSARTGAEGLDMLGNHIVDLAVLDIGLPDINGIELISMIRDLSADTDLVMLTGMNDAGTAVAALKAGAVDYMTKPFDVVEFRSLLHRVMKARFALKQSLLQVRDRGDRELIGDSKVMQELRREIRTAAAVGSPVLIRGETGTGKELVARAVYGLGGEGKGVFVKVDCGTLSAGIVESELFGHERGAFTGAKQRKRGVVEMADGGTLFLDEIGNLPLELQPKLLRLIEESTFRRVGGLKDVHIDVRIIAATNLDLEAEVRNGRFREDLYYRINVISLEVPPLRTRGDDTMLLAGYFLGLFRRETKKEVKGFTPEAVRLMGEYGWPGNVRELKNAVERAVIYCRGGWITPADLNLRGGFRAGGSSREELVPLDAMEASYIRKVLSAVGGNKTAAARILGISRTTLREKLRLNGS